jgi:hypothetical protein
MLCLPWKIDPLGRTSKWEKFPVQLLGGTYQGAFVRTIGYADHEIFHCEYYGAYNNGEYEDGCARKTGGSRGLISTFKISRDYKGKGSNVVNNVSQICRCFVASRQAWRQTREDIRF